MKIFKNKFFIIALSVSIFITVLCSTLSIMGKGDFLKDAANIIVTPFRYVAIKISDSFNGFSKYFKEIEEIHKENEELKKEILRLEIELDKEKGASNENEILRRYLNIKKNHDNFELLDALIIGYSSDEIFNFFTLNRGSGDGVELGMPIINEVGLIGTVCEVGYNWCRVRVISEASSGIGAYVKRSGDTGVISGTVPNNDGRTCILEYLPENADIEVGDLIYTSGKGSTCPRDIFIGRVTSVNIDKYLRRKTATVESAVDIENMRYVMIITDYEINTEN